MRRLRRQDEGDVFDHMQRMFDEMQQMGKTLVPGGQFPVDIREEDGEIVISADLPGVDKDDISLTADEESVEITAEGQEEIKEENEKYFRKERSERRYRRKVHWPSKVDPDTISADYSDGVLEIRAEKEDDSEGRDIEIE